MGYPLGRAPMEDGTGTTPADLQRIIGSMYVSSGLIPNGGLTVSGTSSMAYKVTPGAAFVWTSYASQLGVLVPVDGITVQTDPAPAVGTRIDTVYVDGSGAVRVAVGSKDVPSGVAIGRFTVPAGITATTAAAKSIDRDFAIRADGFLGRLARWTDPGGGAAGMAETVRYEERFYLPSDRVLRIDLTTTIKSATSTPGSVEFIVEITNANGVWRRQMDIAHTPAWDTRSATWSFGTREGENRVRLLTNGKSGGTWMFSAQPRSVTEMSVWDGGPNR